MQGRLDPDDLSSRRRRYLALAVYGSAKQAHILFAAEAARRWPDILSTSFHPGVVRTRFGAGNPFYTGFYRYAPGLRTPAKGAQTLVWLATASASTLHNGGYHVDLGPGRASARATDPGLAARLGQVSLTATGLPQPAP
jgi:NAD(P)-dependent dehydrogenase (short-subunit alcohol dehydrogenase family)